MTEKELLSKLNNLKEFKPDTAWKSQNRDILLSQISGTTSDEQAGFFEILENLLPQNLAVAVARPAWVFAVIAFIVLTGGALGLKAASVTKPGDSLYIAKRINEKTQLALTFNDEKKAKLNLEFAGNRAEEIARVIEESDQEENEVVEELTYNFKKEMTEAKTRLSKRDKKSEAAEEAAETSRGASSDEKKEEKAEENTAVFGANLEKEAAGMQIAEQAKPENKIEINLTEAEKLFEQKDYRGAAGKISELNKIIDNPKEEPKAATSTKEVGEGKEETASSTK